MNGELFCSAARFVKYARQLGIPPALTQSTLKAVSPELVRKSAYYVYFIGARGKIKIGISRSPLKRMSGLQTSNGDKLRLLGVIPMRSKRVARELEHELHKRFEHLRRAGECPKIYTCFRSKRVKQSKRVPRNMKDIPIVTEANSPVLSGSEQVCG